jgi:hypothetical protein
MKCFSSGAQSSQGPLEEIPPGVPDHQPQRREEGVPQVHRRRHPGLDFTNLRFGRKVSGQIFTYTRPKFHPNAAD